MQVDAATISHSIRTGIKCFANGCAGQGSSKSEREVRQGKVSLVGAGPGDPDLITVKGLHALQNADVVVYDRLVALELIEHARDDAILIDVGKQPKSHRVPQEEIQQLIVQFALIGCHVVRLKGGDPFVFGRGFEELQMCRKNDVACEVIPGLTSAIAGPAAAGIPVTTRGIARSFGVLTAESGSAFDDPNHDWHSIAGLDTVVILMGRRTLARSTAALIAAGKEADTHVACIERATLGSQRTVQGTLETIAEVAERENLESPMVIVVGEVAGYASQVQWAAFTAQFVGDTSG